MLGRGSKIGQRILDLGLVLSLPWLFWLEQVVVVTATMLSQ
jgi:hypothetical protein